MLYLRMPDDSFQAWDFGPINGVRHPRDIGSLWGDAELADLGLYRPLDADAVPPGKVSIGRSVQEVEGVVKWVHELTDLQPTGKMVNAERDRRVELGAVISVTGYGPVRLTGTTTDTRNLQALAFSAQLRIGQGDTSTLTPFRDADNVIHQLTPMEVIDLWAQGSAFVSALFQAAWALKDAESGIPADYIDDSYWGI